MKNVNYASNSFQSRLGLQRVYLFYVLKQKVSLKDHFILHDKPTPKISNNILFFSMKSSVLSYFPNDMFQMKMENISNTLTEEFILREKFWSIEELLTSLDCSVKR